MKKLYFVNFSGGEEKKEYYLKKIYLRFIEKYISIRFKESYICNIFENYVVDIQWLKTCTISVIKDRL